VGGVGVGGGGVGLGGGYLVFWGGGWGGGVGGVGGGGGGVGGWGVWGRTGRENLKIESQGELLKKMAYDLRHLPHWEHKHRIQEYSHPRQP